MSSCVEDIVTVGFPDAEMGAGVRVSGKGCIM